MKSVYLIGIGGAGLSGLARYLHHEGYAIYGVDPKSSDVTDALRQDIDATIYHEHKASHIPTDCQFVVYSPAVPHDNIERTEARVQGILEYSYPEYLGVISESKTTIAIAGTNGKTTTTSMVATILDEYGFDPTVIVGGVMPRFGSNFHAGDSEYFVVEACEYKESFLHLHPDVIVITNMTPDHLDYFGTVDNYYITFRRFIGNLREGGVVVLNRAIPESEELALFALEHKYRVVDYGIYAYHDLELPIPGKHNIDNAAAALAACVEYGVEPKRARAILESSFETAKRRFEFIGRTKAGVEVYDDYAHNPEALEVLIEGVRTKYPDKKLVMVFQPHLYSRTEKFYEQFVRVLTGVDVLYLLPIYAAREQQKHFDVSSERLAASIRETSTNVEVELVADINDAEEQLKAANYDDKSILITAGAGIANKLAQKLVV